VSSEFDEAIKEATREGISPEALEELVERDGDELIKIHAQIVRNLIPFS